MNIAWPWVKEYERSSLARGSYFRDHPLPDGYDGVWEVGYWNAKVPQAWGIDHHREAGLHICCLMRGKLTFGTRDHYWELRPGQTYVFLPWQEYHLGNPVVGASHARWIFIDIQAQNPLEPWTWPSWVNLSKGDLDRLTTVLQQNKNPVLGADAAIQSAFSLLEENIHQPRSRTLESELRLNTNYLLLALLRALDVAPLRSEDSSTSPTHPVLSFLAQLDDSLGYPWTLDDMARACGLGRSQFSNRCREYTNMSPIEFLIFRRIERASQALLDDTSRSITEIALDHGFQSSQYFATMFRKQTGFSPREFRNQLQRMEL